MAAISTTKCHICHVVAVTSEALHSMTTFHFHSWHGIRMYMHVHTPTEW